MVGSWGQCYKNTMVNYRISFNLTISRVFLTLAPGLTSKRKTQLERLAKDKHSSLLQKFVNYVHIGFIGLAPGST